MPTTKETPLVATTGLDYLATTGRFRRVEPGDQVDAADLDPKALKWMTAGGFLVPVQDDVSDDNQGEGKD